MIPGRDELPLIRESRNSAAQTTDTADEQELIPTGKKSSQLLKLSRLATFNLYSREN
jgi:hypothetical protein